MSATLRIPAGNALILVSDCFVPIAESYAVTSKEALSEYLMESTPAHLTHSRPARVAPVGDRPVAHRTLDPAIRDEVLASVPNLRAFAVSLCGSLDRADDLVQETLLRAFTHIDSFEPGTHMVAWLFTILRNLFRSEYRKRRREVEDIDGEYAETLWTHPAQIGRVEFNELLAALDELQPEQREALILVAAADFSYDQVAAICGCAVGTIKSRVNRARIRLADLLSVDNAGDFGPDSTIRAVLSGCESRRSSIRRSGGRGS